VLEAEVLLGIERGQVVEEDLLACALGLLVVIASTLSSAKYRSPSFGGRIWPDTTSPVRR